MPCRLPPAVTFPAVLHDYGKEVAKAGEEFAGPVGSIQVYGLALIWIGVEVRRSMWLGGRGRGGGGGSRCYAWCIMVAFPKRQLLEL